MTITYEVIVHGLDELVAKLGALPAGMNESAAKSMKAATLLVEAEAKARVPRRTGRLFSSINSEVTGSGGDLIGRVWTDVEYARDVEEGTKPHPIVAHGKALMLPISPMAGAAGYTGSIFGGAKLTGSPRAGQQVVFFKSVHHPGTRARPFMKPALEENTRRIDAIFQAGIDALLEAVAKA